jgi:hypothetical protein
VDVPAPPFGCRVSRTPSGVTVARVTYKADPEKRTFEWEEAQKKAYATPQMFEQEMGIDFSAFLGSLVYPEFQPHATVVKPQPIDWDRAVIYCAIDPHPRTPCAVLWMALTRRGDHICFAEYWPSSAYGKPGPIPESDPPWNLDDVCETINFLESEKVNVWAAQGMADNGGRKRNVYRRIMDYASKGWSAYRNAGEDYGPTFWEAFAERGISCDPSPKEFNLSRDKVGTRLRPRKITTPTGIIERSVIQIYDTCPELIHELSTYRYPSLSPVQVAKQPPIEKPMGVRHHLIDCLEYLEASDPVWFDRTIRPRKTGYRPYAEINWQIPNEEA